jgi:two-component system OmpR family sensor kinase
VVEQLLTLARADPESAAAARSRVDLLELAQSVAHAHDAIASAQETTLAVELRDAPLVVHGDRASLRTMLDNLVANALRHGRSGTGPETIKVRAHRGASGEAVLEVEDAGPGIPSAERERAFDRFYRGERAAGNGTGLGLAIVRRIAQLHGGRAELLPGTGGKGLLARVVLPLSPT